ncbi:hypothetical protein OROHE_007305 [Orobanche hederae]
MLGGIWTLFSFLASIFTFIRIHEQRAVGRTRVTPYLFMLLSAVMGAYTAILELNYMELQTNLVGCILEMSYIYVYLYYAPNARVRAFKILGSLITLFVIQVILISNLATRELKAPIAKLIPIIFSIIILVLPLPTVIEAVRTRTLDMITPFWLSLTLTLAYIVTFTYNVLGKHLSHIFYAPEICGVILGIIQMVLYYVVRSQQVSISPQQNSPAPIIPQQNPPALVPHQQDPPEGQIIVNIESLDGVESQSSEQQMIMNTEVVDEVGSSLGTQEIIEDERCGFIELEIMVLAAPGT